MEHKAPDRRGQWITGKVYNIQKFGIFVEAQLRALGFRV